MKKTGFLKVIAFSLSLLFTVNSAVWASPDLFNRIEIPSDKGRISELWQAPARVDVETDNPFVIILQDAHESIVAQKNIGEILNLLFPEFKNEKILIGVEGATGEVDCEDLRAFPIAEARRRSAESMLEQGYLTGAEFGAVISRERMDMWGVEDRELFKQNFREFHFILSKKDDIEFFLSKVENSLIPLKNKIYSDELLGFDRALRSYRKGKSDFESFFQILYEKMEKSQMDELEFMNLSLFKEILKIEHSIDPELKEKQWRLFFALIKVEMKEMKQAEKLALFEEKTIEDPALRRKFATISKEIELYRKRALLDVSGMFEEVYLCAEEVEKKMAESSIEKTVLNLDRKYRLLSSLLLLRATEREVKDVLGEGEVDLNSYAAEIRKVISDVGLGIADDLTVPNVLNDTERFLSFYRNAAKRDLVITDRFLNKLKEENRKCGALVVGGFHSRGIVKELKKRGVSYAVITPEIGEDAGSSTAYIDRMMGKLVPLDPVMTSFITASRLNAFATEICGEISREAIFRNFGIKWEESVVSNLDWSSALYLIAGQTDVAEKHRVKASKLYLICESFASAVNKHGDGVSDYGDLIVANRKLLDEGVAVFNEEKSSIEELLGEFRDEHPKQFECDVNEYISAVNNVADECFLPWKREYAERLYTFVPDKRVLDTRSWVEFFVVLMDCDDVSDDLKVAVSEYLILIGKKFKFFSRERDKSAILKKKDDFWRPIVNLSCELSFSGKLSNQTFFLILILNIKRKLNYHTTSSIENNQKWIKTMINDHKSYCPKKIIAFYLSFFDTVGYSVFDSLSEENVLMLNSILERHNPGRKEPILKKRALYNTSKRDLLKKEDERIKSITGGRLPAISIRKKKDIVNGISELKGDFFARRNILTGSIEYAEIVSKASSEYLCPLSVEYINHLYDFIPDQRMYFVENWFELYLVLIETEAAPDSLKENIVDLLDALFEKRDLLTKFVDSGLTWWRGNFAVELFDELSCELSFQGKLLNRMFFVLLLVRVREKLNYHTVSSLDTNHKWVRQYLRESNEYIPKRVLSYYFQLLDFLDRDIYAGMNGRYVTMIDSVIDRLNPNDVPANHHYRTANTQKERYWRDEPLKEGDYDALLSVLDEIHFHIGSFFKGIFSDDYKRARRYLFPGSYNEDYKRVYYEVFDTLGKSNQEIFFMLDQVIPNAILNYGDENGAFGYSWKEIAVRFLLWIDSRHLASRIQSALEIPFEDQDIDDLVDLLESVESGNYVIDLLLNETQNVDKVHEGVYIYKAVWDDLYAYLRQYVEDYESTVFFNARKRQPESGVVVQGKINVEEGHVGAFKSHKTATTVMDGSGFFVIGFWAWLAGVFDWMVPAILLIWAGYTLYHYWQRLTFEKYYDYAPKFVGKVERLMREAQNNMPRSNDENPEWTEFESVVEELRSCPNVDVLVAADDKSTLKGLDYVLKSSRVVSFDEIKRYFNKNGMLSNFTGTQQNYVFAAMENISQHVRNGVLLVIREQRSDHTRLTVIDNGPGFYDSFQNKLKIRQVIKAAKSFGINGSMGLGLTAITGRYPKYCYIENQGEWALTRSVSRGNPFVLMRGTRVDRDFGVRLTGFFYKKAPSIKQFVKYIRDRSLLNRVDDNEADAEMKFTELTERISYPVSVESVSDLLRFSDSVKRYDAGLDLLRLRVRDIILGNTIGREQTSSFLRKTIEELSFQHLTPFTDFDSEMYFYQSSLFADIKDTVQADSDTYLQKVFVELILELGLLHDASVFASNASYTADAASDLSEMVQAYHHVSEEDYFKGNFFDIKHPVMTFPALFEINKGDRLKQIQRRLYAAFLRRLRDEGLFYGELKSEKDTHQSEVVVMQQLLAALSVAVDDEISGFHNVEEELKVNDLQPLIVFTGEINGWMLDVLKSASALGYGNFVAASKSDVENAANGEELLKRGFCLRDGDLVFCEFETPKRIDFSVDFASSEFLSEEKYLMQVLVDAYEQKEAAAGIVQREYQRIRNMSVDRLTEEIEKYMPASTDSIEQFLFFSSFVKAIRKRGDLKVYLTAVKDRGSPFCNYDYFLPIPDDYFAPGYCMDLFICKKRTVPFLSAELKHIVRISNYISAEPPWNKVLENTEQSLNELPDIDFSSAIDCVFIKGQKAWSLHKYQPAEAFYKMMANGRINQKTTDNFVADVYMFDGPQLAYDAWFRHFFWNRVDKCLECKMDVLVLSSPDNVKITMSARLREMFRFPRAAKFFKKFSLVPFWTVFGVLGLIAGGYYVAVKVKGKFTGWLRNMLEYRKRRKRDDMLPIICGSEAESASVVGELKSFTLSLNEPLVLGSQVSAGLNYADLQSLKSGLKTLSENSLPASVFLVVDRMSSKVFRILSEAIVYSLYSLDVPLHLNIVFYDKNRKLTDEQLNRLNRFLWQIPANISAVLDGESIYEGHFWKNMKDSARISLYSSKERFSHLFKSEAKEAGRLVPNQHRVLKDVAEHNGGCELNTVINMVEAASGRNQGLYPWIYTALIKLLSVYCRDGFAGDPGLGEELERIATVLQKYCDNGISESPSEVFALIQLIVTMNPVGILDDAADLAEKIGGMLRQENEAALWQLLELTEIPWVKELITDHDNAPNVLLNKLQHICMDYTGHKAEIFTCLRSLLNDKQIEAFASPSMDFLMFFLERIRQAVKDLDAEEAVVYLRESTAADHMRILGNANLPDDLLSMDDDALIDLLPEVFPSAWELNADYSAVAKIIDELKRRDMYVQVFRGVNAKTGVTLKDRILTEKDHYSDLRIEFRSKLHNAGFNGEDVDVLALTVENIVQHAPDSIMISIWRRTKTGNVIADFFDNGRGFCDVRGRRPDINEVIRWSSSMGSGGNKGEAMLYVIQKSPLILMEQPGEIALFEKGGSGVFLGKNPKKKYGLHYRVFYEIKKPERERIRDDILKKLRSDYDVKGPKSPVAYNLEEIGPDQVSGLVLIGAASLSFSVRRMLEEHPEISNLVFIGPDAEELVANPAKISGLGNLEGRVSLYGMRLAEFGASFRRGESIFIVDGNEEYVDHAKYSFQFYIQVISAMQSGDMLLIKNKATLPFNDYKFAQLAGLESGKMQDFSLDKFSLESRFQNVRRDKEGTVFTLPDQKGVLFVKKYPVSSEVLRSLFVSDHGFSDECVSFFQALAFNKSVVAAAFKSFCDAYESHSGRKMDESERFHYLLHIIAEKVSVENISLELVRSVFEECFFPYCSETGLEIKNAMLSIVKGMILDDTHALDYFNNIGLYESLPMEDDKKHYLFDLAQPRRVRPLLHLGAYDEEAGSNHSVIEIQYEFPRTGFLSDVLTVLDQHDLNITWMQRKPVKKGNGMLLELGVYAHDYSTINGVVSRLSLIEDRFDQREVMEKRKTWIFECEVTDQPGELRKRLSLFEWYGIRVNCFITPDIAGAEGNVRFLAELGVPEKLDLKDVYPVLSQMMLNVTNGADEDFFVYEGDLVSRMTYELIDEFSDKYSDEEREAFEDALRAVARKKIEAARKDRRSPFMSHFTEVAKILRNEMGCTDFKAVLAALLHDAVEDKDMTGDEVLSMFGADVHEIVMLLSKAPNEKDKRKEYIYLNRLVEARGDNAEIARLIKIADRIHNLRTIDTGKNTFKRKIFFSTLQSFYFYFAAILFPEKTDPKYRNALKNGLDIFSKEVRRQASLLGFFSSRGMLMKAQVDKYLTEQKVSIPDDIDADSPFNFLYSCIIAKDRLEAAKALPDDYFRAEHDLLYRRLNEFTHINKNDNIRHYLDELYIVWLYNFEHFDEISMMNNFSIRSRMPAELDPEEEKLVYSILLSVEQLEYVSRYFEEYFGVGRKIAQSMDLFSNDDSAGCVSILRKIFALYSFSLDSVGGEDSRSLENRACVFVDGLDAPAEVIRLRNLFNLKQKAKFQMEFSYFISPGVRGDTVLSKVVLESLSDIKGTGIQMQLAAAEEADLIICANGEAWSDKRHAFVFSTSAASQSAEVKLFRTFIIQLFGNALGREGGWNFDLAASPFTENAAGGGFAMKSEFVDRIIADDRASIFRSAA